MNDNFWHVWTIPLLLGGVSVLGLLAALVGDGFMDLVSWISLTIPLLVTGWFVIKPRSRTRNPKSQW